MIIYDSVIENHTETAWEQPPEVFCKKDDPRNFAKFTGKHLCLRPATLLKKRLGQVLSCKFCEISKSTFSTEHSRTTASDHSDLELPQCIPNNQILQAWLVSPYSSYYYPNFDYFYHSPFMQTLVLN